jgi:hypothetical protein
MIRKLTISVLIVILFLPVQVFANQYWRPKKKAQAQPELMEQKSSGLSPAILSDEEYERQMVSAGKHIFAGFLLTSIGGVTALAGTTYAIVKSDDRKTGGIISACGLAMTLSGMIITIVGYHKRNKAQGYHISVAPVIDLDAKKYALMYSMEF